MQIHQHINELGEYVFPSHYQCWQGRWDIIALHAVGDSLTMVSYYLIPITLGIILYRYRFGKHLKRLFAVYGVFILLCGTTHLFDVIMIWRVNEQILLLDGWLRVATGAVSVCAWAATVYAAIHFRRTFEELLLLKAELIRERDNFRAVSGELTARWKGFSEKIEDFIQPPDST